MKLKPNRFKHRTIYGTTNFWGCGISFKMHSGNEKCEIRVFATLLKVQIVKEIKRMENNLKNEFMRTFHILSYSHNKWDVWNDFIYMSACSFANVFDKKNYAKREEEYLRIIKKYNKNEQKLFPKNKKGISRILEKGNSP